MTRKAILGLVFLVGIAYGGRYATSTKIYVQQSNWKKALESIEKWKEEEPNSAEPYLWEGYVKTRQEDYVASAKAFLKAYSMDPKLFEKDNFEKKLSITGQKMLTKEQLVIVLTNASVKLYNDGNYDEAIPILEFIITLDPQNGQAYNMLASIYQIKASEENNKEYLSKAKAYLEKYHELNPEDPRANLFLGRLYYNEALSEEDSTRKVELLEKARVLLEKAVSKGNEEAKYELGMLYSDIGKNEEALKYLYDYARNNPNEYEVWFNLAVVAINAKNDSIAYEALKKAVEIKPDDYTANYLLSVLEAKMKKYEDALKHIDQALSVKETPEAYEHKAIILRELGRNKEALKLLEKAEKLKKQ